MSVSLGFDDYVTPNKGGNFRAQKLLQRYKHIEEEVEEKADDMEMLPLLEKVMDETQSFIDTSFGGDGEGISERERRGFDDIIQKIRGAIKLHKANMILYNSEIIKAEGKLEQLEEQQAGAAEGQKANLDEEITKVNEKIKDLNEKKNFEQEAHGLLSSDIYPQLRVIKETLIKISGDDMSLLEKLKILFKEQGIAIASIVSAIGLLVSTMVLSVTGGSAMAGAAGGAGKGFGEKQLERLGKFLKYVAGKAGAALPGIIDTVVSFFLRVAATVVEYAAKHLYMAITAAAGFVVLYVGKTKKA